MQTVHITTGLPASGKTTFALEVVEESQGGVRRVNLDDIRAMLDTGVSGRRVWSPELEETALKIQDAAVRAALDDGFDVIVDNTMLVPHIPKRIKNVVRGDATFKVHDFTHVPIQTCIERDAKREASVGEDVIRRLADRHAKATKGGWWLTDAWMNDHPAIQPYTPNRRVPLAIICDIDGTLALNNNGRSPYDWARVGEDKINEPVLEALEAFQDTYGDKIILLSGRDGSCQPQTVDWLIKNSVSYDELHMRAAGDTRPDDIVKAELFDKHVRDRFAVRLVLDDRDRVVALWRHMGLPTWQVNYGNF
jgi:predicted kinase